MNWPAERETGWWICRAEGTRRAHATQVSDPHCTRSGRGWPGCQSLAPAKQQDRDCLEMTQKTAVWLTWKLTFSFGGSTRKLSIAFLTNIESKRSRVCYRAKWELSNLHAISSVWNNISREFTVFGVKLPWLVRCSNLPATHNLVQGTAVLWAKRWPPHEHHLSLAC